MKQKQERNIIIISFVVVLALTITMIGTVHIVNRKMTQYCFAELEQTAMHVAEDLRDTAAVDTTLLTVVANNIASREKINDEILLSAMNSFDTGSTYITYLEYLDSDNRLLNQYGSIADVSGKLDFAVEAARGHSISDEEREIYNPENIVVRNAVPVIKDGEVIGILYGVIALDEFVKLYETNLYGGSAYVYLEDGDTGDFLLDTWHDGLRKIYDYGERKPLRGYDFDAALEDMRTGTGGRVSFISHTTGHALYMEYQPSGINNWNVLITVEKDTAFEQSRGLSQNLYFMVGIESIVLFAYTAFVVTKQMQAYRKIKKMGFQDKTTRLQNRNAYDKYEDESSAKQFDVITCVYVDANGLHEVNNRYGHAEGDKFLRIIADALRREFIDQNIYRIGGDEFVVMCENMDETACTHSIRHVLEHVKKDGYSAAYGIATRKEETGIGRVTREADEKMLENKKAYYTNHDRRGR